MNSRTLSPSPSVLPLKQPKFNSPADFRQRFDVLIGRLVLMYLTDPAVVLRRLIRFLKPGGLVVFQELDTTGCKSEPVCNLFETSLGRINQTFTRVGADTQTGLKLARIFQEAGLPRPQMIQGVRVESGPDSEAYRVVAQLTRTLLPLMERTGVATAAEVGIDTLADRLREEAVALNATWVLPSFIGAWVRRPVTPPLEPTLQDPQNQV